MVRDLCWKTETEATVKVVFTSIVVFKDTNTTLNTQQKTFDKTYFLLYMFKFNKPLKVTSLCFCLVSSTIETGNCGNSIVVRLSERTEEEGIVRVRAQIPELG